MDPRTRAIYEERAEQWIELRRPRLLHDGSLDAFAAQVPPGGRVADLGCGPGWYAAAFRERGLRPVALDISGAMLRAAATRAPGVPRVRADLVVPPFAPRSLDAAWAPACYMHLPAAELPAALARLHRALRTGGPVKVALVDLETRSPAQTEGGADEVEVRFEDDPFGGRLFTLLTAARARELLRGAGFERIALTAAAESAWLTLDARAARTLPDWIAPGLRLLVCGLNPSLYAADAGIPFARPGNRFWPAARRAGLVLRDRDPSDALRRGIGFTDCAKRATARASELSRAEYAAGLARVEALVRRYAPRAVCFVGLEGYRRAIERRAAPGWLSHGFAGRPAYLMPSTSGLNARATPDALTAHLRAAAAGP